jgi:hypothetical protein
MSELRVVDTSLTLFITLLRLIINVIFLITHIRPRPQPSHPQQLINYVFKILAATKIAALVLPTHSCANA